MKTEQYVDSIVKAPVHTMKFMASVLDREFLAERQGVKYYRYKGHIVAIHNGYGGITELTAVPEYQPGLSS